MRKIRYVIGLGYAYNVDAIASHRSAQQVSAPTPTRLVVALSGRRHPSQAKMDSPLARVHPIRVLVEAAELTTSLHEAGMVGVEKE